MLFSHAISLSHVIRGGLCMRRCARTSEERSGLNQPTNPPGFRFFLPNPVFVKFFSGNFSKKQKSLQGALARAQKSCMQSPETVIYPENLKFYVNATVYYSMSHVQICTPANQPTRGPVPTPSAPSRHRIAHREP